jgi:Flp pilus assembly protein TadD
MKHRKPAAPSGGPRGSARSTAAVMALTFVLALAVRVAYVLAFRASPFFSHLIVDGQWHDEWAWALARGAWSMDGHAFFRAPLYPFWLSLIYRVFGHDLLAARVVQAVVGAGTAAAIAGSAHRLGGRVAGLAAGILAAFYGTLVFFDGELLIPNLLLGLMSWALFFLLGRPRLRNVAAAGALLGLAAVARPNALAVLPAAAAYVWWRWRAGGGPQEVRGGSSGSAARAGASGRARRSAWTAAAGVAGLGLLPALIVTGVNTAVEGSFVFVSSQGGVNFYAGNHARASGRSVEIPELRNIVSWQQFVGQSREVAERAAGRPLSSREVSDWWLRRGLRWMGSHPADALGLYAKKAYYLVNAFEAPNNRDIYFDRRGPVRWLVWKTWPLAFPWGLVFPLAVVGWIAAWRERRMRGGAALLTGWFVLYALSLLPFFETARFRLPLVIPVVIAAGYAVARWRSVFRGPALAAGVAALVVVNTGFFQARLENPALETARMGEVLLRSGRIEEGTALLERAHRKLPTDVSISNLLADAYGMAGKLEDAAKLYNDVLMARPDDPDVRFNLGATYLQLDRFDDAANQLQVVVRLRPKDAGAWVNLGIAYEALGRDTDAIEAYSRGVDLAPGDTLPYLRLGMLYLKRRDSARAVSVFRAGADLNPGSFDLRYHLALAYLADEQPDRAKAEVARALALKPGDPQAVKLQRYLAAPPDSTGEGR